MEVKSDAQRLAARKDERMQIILNREECTTIYEALITEIAEAKEDLEKDKKKGKLTVFSQDRLDKIRFLKLRFEPYTG